MNNEITVTQVGEGISVLDGDFDTVLKYLAARRETLDDAVADWQAALAPGDYFLREDGDLFVFGEILNEDEYTTAEEREFLGATPPNTRFARVFSVICPEGELGHIHVADAHFRLTKAKFEAARVAGWPDTAEALRRELGIVRRGAK